jgi:hypothetical protein
MKAEPGDLDHMYQAAVCTAQTPMLLQRLFRPTSPGY